MKSALLALFTLALLLGIPHLHTLDRALVPHTLLGLLTILYLFLYLHLQLALLHDVTQIELAAKRLHALRVLVQESIGPLDALLALRCLKCSLLPVLDLAALFLLINGSLASSLLLPSPCLQRVVPPAHSISRHVAEGLFQIVILHQQFQPSWAISSFACASARCCGSGGHHRARVQRITNACDRNWDAM